MELTERLPLLKLNYLAQMTFKDFKMFCSVNSKNDDERRAKYDMMIAFAKAHIKNDGSMARLYAFTEKNPVRVEGRLYCAYSIQGLQRQIRGFLGYGITTDIDMKNAHIVIARYLCKLHNIPTPHLEYYINNRDDILIQLGANAKERFLCALNYDKTNKKETNKILRDFDKECKMIQAQLTALPEYAPIVNSVPASRTHNWLGSAFNRILCVYENRILQSLIRILTQKNIEICALCFDGLLMYGNHYDDSSLLSEIESTINAEYPGLDMKWAYKPHETDIVMPSGWQPECEAKTAPDRDYESVKRRFEETHLFISNKSIYIYQSNGENIMMSKTQFITSTEHISYDVVIKNEIQSKCFVLDWVRDENKRMKRDIGIYPPDVVCPDSIFNMWSPFAMEDVSEWSKDENAISMMRKHIEILCGNDKAVADYFELWIAQMIQFPSTKSIFPVIISKEGAGKGTLMRLFERMFGSQKILQTTKPSADVWGNFNGRMDGAFLVNLDELSKKEAEGADGYMKGLITEPTITINRKGVESYQTRSFHRFFGTTNNEDSLRTSRDDRRNMIVRASDELIGNKTYFDTMYTILNDDNAVKSIYEYFKTMPGADCFGKLKIPLTEWQADVQKAYSHPIELWIFHYARQNINLDYVEKSMGDYYDSFKEFVSEYGFKYECNITSFGLKLKNLKIDGVCESKRCNFGMVRRLEIKKILVHCERMGV